MKRALILLSIVVIGLAAPARAWCEATCAQPVAEQKTHCPTHSQGSGTSLVASDADQCRAIDGARTVSPARLYSADAQLLAATEASGSTRFASPLRASAPYALSAPYAPSALSFAPLRI